LDIVSSFEIRALDFLAQGASGVEGLECGIDCW